MDQIRAPISFQRRRCKGIFNTLKKNRALDQLTDPMSIIKSDSQGVLQKALARNPTLTISINCLH
ncbi:MAG: hypothetical protein ACI8Z5_002576 [Lentimonas sp.]|jgi:hypothetical protein